MARLRNLVTRCIVRLADVFVDGFGSPTCFAICVCLLVGWLALIPVLGLVHWNATVGLGGNTSESTIELFIAVATLIVARRVDKSHAGLLEHMAAQLDHLERIAEHLDVPAPPAS